MMCVANATDVYFFWLERGVRVLEVGVGACVARPTVLCTQQFWTTAGSVLLDSIAVPLR